MNTAQLKILVVTLIIFFVPQSLLAAETYSSTKISGDNLQNNGALINWNGIELSVPSGAFVDATRFKFRDRGNYGTQTAIPRLPNKFRSKNVVYAFSIDKDAGKEIAVTLDYKSRRLRKQNRVRRIFYLAPGAVKWQKLRSIVNSSDETVEAILPSSAGKLVVAKHRYRKERPIKKGAYSNYRGIPYSDTAAVLDSKSGKFLYREQAKKQRSIASISKLATSLIFLESKPNLDDVIAYSPRNDRIGATVNLARGDTLTLKQVLMAVLIPSANNMAVTLSQSTYMTDGEFIQQMNNRVRELGLKKTKFVEPSGLNSQNMSTAANISRLARYTFNKYPDIYWEAAHTGQYYFTLDNSGRGITMYSTNKFDGQGKLELVSFKTGYLPGTAERTIVMKIRENSTKYEIILALLGNPQYNTIFQEAYDLADWSFNNWEFHNY